MPKIAVLMPVYNASRFLSSAIESILAQTFTDFEFIIIDDCSTDDSVNIIRSYNDDRIRFYANEKNLGISSTLNKGIKLASAEWIARMDSDDISYPQRLQNQYDFILQHPDGDLFSCWVKVVNQEEQFMRQDVFESRYYYYNLYFMCWIYHPTVVYSKKAVVNAGMYAMQYSEDFELFWQITRTCKMYNQPQVLMDYRVTDQSLHQVLRKKEYMETQHSILQRNFKTLAGEYYQLPASYLDCLQHNFEPLLNEKSGKSVAVCIKELRYLTDKILVTENVNKNDSDIREAAYFKERFIINYFLDKLPKPESVKLLFYLRKYKEGLKRLLK